MVRFYFIQVPKLEFFRASNNLCIIEVPTVFSFELLPRSNFRTISHTDDERIFGESLWTFFHLILRYLIFYCFSPLQRTFALLCTPIHLRAKDLIHPIALLPVSSSFSSPSIRKKGFTSRSDVPRTNLSQPRVTPRSRESHEYDGRWIGYREWAPVDGVQNNKWAMFQPLFILSRPFDREIGQWVDITIR